VPTIFGWNEKTATPLNTELVSGKLRKPKETPQNPNNRNPKFQTKSEDSNLQKGCPWTTQCSISEDPLQR